MEKQKSSHLQKLIWLILSTRLAVRFYEWILWNQIKTGSMPNHIGVILDGNRRWAQAKRLAPWLGHSEGAKKVEDFLDWINKFQKIKATTFYVFSTENFRRPKEEIGEIMDLLNYYFTSLLDDERIHRNKIRIKVIGKTEMLPLHLQDSISALENATKGYDGYFLNLAIAYGGRAEILDAVRKIAVDVKDGLLNPRDLDENVIEERLYTFYLPNPHPDLIVRTSGEERLSNFLLWQSAYSELCFLDVFWPSFRKIDLMRAIRLYQQRQRRYGA